MMESFMVWTFAPATTTAMLAQQGGANNNQKLFR